ncbi:hypothetical protein CLU79DRAFT_780431 [Phycomyces nitens]|nr:hypothetical protein CLU79DRAFT_780431 [Phycomyces nitens]
MDFQDYIDLYNIVTLTNMSRYRLIHPSTLIRTSKKIIARGCISLYILKYLPELNPINFLGHDQRFHQMKHVQGGQGFAS